MQFAEAAEVVIWLQGICAHAAHQSDWDLLEEAAHTMCTWDGTLDQRNAQDRIRPWLVSLTGDAAAVMASVLRDHPEAAQHFSSVADDRTAARAFVRPSARAPHCKAARTRPGRTPAGRPGPRRAHGLPPPSGSPPPDPALAVLRHLVDDLATHPTGSGSA
ncbi:hypothetical protein [Streptomyces sp. NPDC005780]|uniref:hypothetical protein n=1 Tax=Streptomyces sp. NPDC005780 TaxID=3364730 RepID=UPI0036B23EBD